jgi:hypothetical protein
MLSLVIQHVLPPKQGMHKQQDKNRKEKPNKV